MTIQNPKLVFFDVFDTLLTRKVIYPSSVFYFAGMQAIKLKLIDCSAETYVYLRQEAEKLSRKEAVEGQIHCERIFEYLSELISVNKDICMQLMQLELEWESKLLFEIPGAKKLVEKERMNGHQIVYVSDMYWSSDVIRTFLENANIFQKEDKIWVSSEHGASKDSGNLFKKIFPHFSNINLSEIRHFGNDYFIDYQGAIKAGIKPILLEKANPNRYEILLEQSRDQTNGISSVLSGSGRYFRLLNSEKDVKTAEIARIVGNIAGPSMLMYCLWILREAKNRTINQLCFISRDGYVPFVICSKIGPKLGYDFNYKYVYGSRQSWHIAGIREFNSDTYSWLFDSYSTLKLISILKRLGISWEKLIELAPEVLTLTKDANTPLDKNTITTLKNIFENNKQLRSFLLELAAEKRQLLKDYLSENNIDFSQKTGMIEIGWKGKTRMSFEKALGNENASNMHWFYLGLNQNIKQNTNRYSTFLYGPELDYLSIDALPQIFESFCFAPHGSVKSFEKKEGKTRAIFNDKIENKLDIWGRQIYLDYISSYCDNLPIDILQNYDIPNMRHTAYNLLKQFCEKPDKSDAIIWGDIPFMNNQEDSECSILAPNIKFNLTTVKQALTYGKIRIAANGGQSTSWGAGAWIRRKKKMWPLYIFIFIGYIRVNKTKELRRILRETKHYLKRLFYP